MLDNMKFQVEELNECLEDFKYSGLSIDFYDKVAKTLTAMAEAIEELYYLRRWDKE
jgi:hypothetical protein